jgi:prepilin-type processing-associated H-X9-DG protein
MITGNSANHNRDGQNILYGDGHVAWESSPFVGVERDNVYTYGDSGTKSGGTGIVGSAVGPNDSVLLPTALDIGLLDKWGKPTAEFAAMLDKRVGRIPPAPADMQAAADKLQGRYVRDDAKAGGQMTLVIAKDKITFTKGGAAARAYDWHIADLTGGDGGARVELSLPQEVQARTIAAWPDGNVLFIAGDPELAGRWTKQP